MSNKKAPRFPVGLWLGKYEHWLITLKGETSLRFADPTLNRFLETFPNKKGLEEFTSVDVADYRAIREAQGVSCVTLRRELLVLRAFWKWLIEDRELAVVPIKRAFDLHVEQTAIRKRVGITLACIKRLLEECSPEIREVVFDIMLGNYPLPRGKRAAAIYVAARKAGLRDFILSKLRIRVMQRLGKDIIKSYLQELRHTFTQKTEPSADSLTDIKASIAASGSSIGNNDNNSFSVIGINK